MLSGVPSVANFLPKENISGRGASRVARQSRPKSPVTPESLISGARAECAPISETTAVIAGKTRVTTANSSSLRRQARWIALSSTGHALPARSALNSLQLRGAGPGSPEW
ncbi:hypothetical protein BSL84_10985 [Streptomyces sp. TN58]|nr:hypothetical protein BSL84_10985 [Streptomyces sp. TN58]